MISCFAQAAAKLGHTITAEEIRKIVEQEEARRKAKAEKIASDMKVLNDDDVEDVAGGASRYLSNDEWHNGCRYSQDGYCSVVQRRNIMTVVAACRRKRHVFFLSSPVILPKIPVP